MDPDTLHKIHVIIGFYTISCLACTYFYGCSAIVAWLIGLFLIAALLNAANGGPGRKL